MMVFAGNANPQLAHKIAARLNLPLGKAQVSKFSDGEVAIELMENVRGRDVFIVQSTCPPTNDNLMELLVMADALRRASAGRITAEATRLESARPGAKCSVPGFAPVWPPTPRNLSTPWGGHWRNQRPAASDGAA